VTSTRQEVQVLFLSEEDVTKTNITMKETTDLVEDVFRAHGEGTAIVPAKMHLDYNPLRRTKAYTAVMPAYLDYLNIVGVKWIGGNFENPVKYGLPSLMGIIILLNPDTLAPLAIMSAGHITAMRTGAVSAVAAKYLADPDSKTLGLIGAGFQGRYQLLALTEVLDLERAKTYDIRRDTVLKFQSEMSRDTRLEIDVASTPKEALQGSDVVIAANTADEPFLKSDWITKGSFLCNIGETNFEFKVTKTVDKIVVDHMEQVKHGGELSKWFRYNWISERDIYAELGDIVIGKKAGRESESDTVLFVPEGMASEDTALALKVYEKATSRGIGKTLPLLGDT
jgi:alanine dehydrogenase